MPKGILQEKFQTTLPRPAREPRTWASFESQRVAHEAPATQMPAGMNSDNQKIPPRGLRDGGLAGSTDESNSVNAAMLGRGYQRQNMRPEDEMYNDEHTEAFYDTVEVDGDVGFVERSNYLDRS